MDGLVVRGSNLPGGSSFDLDLRFAWGLELGDVTDVSNIVADVSFAALVVSHSDNIGSN